MDRITTAMSSLTGRHSSFDFFLFFLPVMIYGFINATCNAFLVAARKNLVNRVSLGELPKQTDTMITLNRYFSWLHCGQCLAFPRIPWLWNFTSLLINKRCWKLLKYGYFSARLYRAKIKKITNWWIVTSGLMKYIGNAMRLYVTCRKYSGSKEVV